MAQVGWLTPGKARELQQSGNESPASLLFLPGSAKLGRKAKMWSHLQTNLLFTKTLVRSPPGFTSGPGEIQPLGLGAHARLRPCNATSLG